MSYKLRNQADNTTLQTHEKSVLQMMATHASDIGNRCSLSIPTIAKLTGMGESTVQRKLKALTEKGFVSVVENHKGGRGKVRVFELSFPTEEKAPAETTFVKPVVATTFDAQKVVTAKPVREETFEKGPRVETLGSPERPPLEGKAPRPEEVNGSKGPALAPPYQGTLGLPGLGYDPGLPPRASEDARVRAKPKPQPKLKPDGGGQTKIAAIIDAVRAEGIPIEVSGRDASAVKRTSASAETIAAAYVAGARGQWGNGWLKGNFALWAVVERIGSFLTSQTGRSENTSGDPMAFKPHTPSWTFRKPGDEVFETAIIDGETINWYDIPDLHIRSAINNRDMTVAQGWHDYQAKLQGAST